MVYLASYVILSRVTAAEEVVPTFEGPRLIFAFFGGWHPKSGGGYWMGVDHDKVWLEEICYWVYWPLVALDAKLCSRYHVMRTCCYEGYIEVW
jgi:hypothetical protein